MDAKEVRALFPILRKRAYMFSGGIAPLSTRAIEALRRHTEYLTNDAGDLYRHTHQDFHASRRLFAGLIGADEDEIAVTDCTSTGSNLSAGMVEPRPGHNVVFDEHSYPSQVYPWALPRRDDVERRFVMERDGRVHLEDLARAIDDNTLAVSISHVSPLTGFRHDLAAVTRLAHEHGALLLVDAAQSAGALRIDVHGLGVDFLACGAMKWLLGAAGVGFLFAARRHLDRLPPVAGYMGASDDPALWDRRVFEPKAGADRFHLGMPNLIGLAATTPGLEILTQVGMGRVEAHVLDLTGYCVDGLLRRGLKVLTPVEPEHRAGIVTIDMEDSRQADEFLYSRGVDTYHFQHYLRIDPHIFNDRGDIDRALEGLDAYMMTR